MTRSMRPSREAIISQLRLAARRGDRTALRRATDQMRIWAHSPRYWKQYLQLLTHPLARLVDLTVIKQGERIAHQKGWATSARRTPKSPARRRPGPSASPTPVADPVSSPLQPSLFPDLAP
jgi:hypothetical protein